MMNATEFGQYLNDVQTLNNTENGTSVALPYPAQADIDALGNGTDWQDEIFRTAPIRNYQLGFNGGNDKTRYNLSMNYFDQAGVIINSGFKRGSIRLNLDRKISNKLNFTFTSQLTRSYENRALVNTSGGSASGVVMDALRINPALPVRDPNTGEYTLRNGPFPYVEPQVGNPVAYANLASDHRYVTRGLLNAALDYEILKGLKLRVSGGTDLYVGFNDYYVPSGIFFLNTVTVGNATKTTNNRYSWLTENTLTYDKKINEHHSFTMMGGMSMQKFDNDFYFTSVQGFFTDALGGNNIGIASSVLPSGSGKNPNRVNQLLSYFGRLNYRINDKYLFTLTMRADGSSRFGANKKFGYFPSGAFAWRVKEESFLKDVEAISDLKLRASYGATGNQEIPSYLSQKQYSANTYWLGQARVNGFSPNNLPNPDLSWESTKAMDLGFDLALFGNRVQLTADYYNKKTTKLLYDVLLPNTSGFTAMTQNIGSVRNQGVEFAINSLNIDKKAVKWTTNFNISVNRNKVLDLGPYTSQFTGKVSSNLFPGGKTSSILQVGKPIGEFYGYVFDGIWQSTDQIKKSGTKQSVKPGDPIYKDLNGDSALDATNDRTVIGHALPKFTYGFTSNFTVGRFNLFVLIQGVQGVDILNENKIEMEAGNAYANKFAYVFNDTWRGEGTSNKLPSAGNSLRRNLGVTSDMLENGSYLRFKTITLSYDLPLAKLTPVFKTGSIYATAQNIFTITDYSGYDPEVNSYSNSAGNFTSLNVDYNPYPNIKTYTVGMKLGF